MSINVGTLQYDVDADTSGLLKAEKDVDRSTKNMEKDFNRVDKNVERLNTRMKEIPASVRSANRQLGNFGRQAGQAGIQIQQFVGQVQGGTNALVALSQQGADLGIVLGAPLIGAVVGISSAIGAALLPSLFDSKTATEELEEAIEGLSEVVNITDGDIVGLTDRLIKLTKTNQDAARVEVARGILDSTKAFDAAADIIQERSEDIISSFTVSEERIAAAVVQFKDSGRELLNAFPENRDFWTRVNFPILTDALVDLRDEFDLTQEEAARLLDALGTQINQRSSDSAANLGKVVADLGVKYRNTNSDLLEFTSAVAKQTTVINQQTEAAKTLNNILEGIGTIDFSPINEIEGPGLKEFDQQQRLDARLAKQEEARLKRSAEQEARARSQKERMLQLAFESETEKIARLHMEREAAITAITEEGSQKRQELRSKNAELTIKATNDLAAREQKLLVESQVQTATAFASSFGNLAQIAKNQGKEGFEAYKRLSQGQAIIAGAVAFNKALAQGGPIAGPILAGSIAGLAGAQIALIEKQTPSGRALGGPVTRGNIFRVGETGPELFKDGNRTMLIPGEDGSIVPLGSGNNQPNITIISNGTPQTIEGTSISMGEVRVMINDANSQLRKEINTSLSTGRGETAKSLKQGFDVKNRLTR